MEIRVFSRAFPLMVANSAPPATSQAYQNKFTSHRLHGILPSVVSTSDEGEVVFRLVVISAGGHQKQPRVNITGADQLLILYQTISVLIQLI